MAEILHQLAEMYKNLHSHTLSLALFYIYCLNTQPTNWCSKQLDLFRIMVCDHGSSNLFGSARVVFLQFKSLSGTLKYLRYLDPDSLSKTTRDARPFCRRMSSPSNGSLNCATTGRLWNRNLCEESVCISICHLCNSSCIAWPSWPRQLNIL